ncbi:hypothetical protein [Parahalioglobus pacificus]|nr:hypothetical protein [Halioglobus pacificus]
MAQFIHQLQILLSRDTTNDCGLQCNFEDNYYGDQICSHKDCE